MILWLLVGYSVLGLLVGYIVYHAETLQGKPGRLFISLFEGVLWPAFAFNFIRNLYDIYQEEH